MLEDFLSYIESNLSVIREDKILLSISGGIDSMVMLHLFKELDYNISVAHINHSTRKGASDIDMAFVESICKQYSIPFYAKTLNYQDLVQGNFQANARKERFVFLQQILHQTNSKWIATAHHKDDRWETFLMHLNRRSGIHGLTILRAQQNQIVHPLLPFTKKDIIKYADQHDIKYVHDTSNDTNDYLRNSIRNKITPEIIKVFPDFIVNANHSINHLTQDFNLLQELIDKSDLISKEAETNYLYIDLEQLKTFTNCETLLFHILEKYDFNYSTIQDILQSNTTGAIFRSVEYEALLDRKQLILRKITERVKTNISISAEGNYNLPDGKSLVVEINNPTNVASHLWINKDKIKWPLTIRSIQGGDKFKPQGMKGATKTIKKICSDLKLSRFAKDDLLVVCENEIIIQIIGIRTSNNFVTDNIKNALTFNIVV